MRRQTVWASTSVCIFDMDTLSHIASLETSRSSRVPNIYRPYVRSWKSFWPARYIMQEYYEISIMDSRKISAWPLLKKAMPGVPDVAGTEVNQHPGKPHALIFMSSHLEHTPRPPNFICTVHRTAAARPNSQFHMIFSILALWPRRPISHIR